MKTLSLLLLFISSLLVSCVGTIEQAAEEQIAKSTILNSTNGLTFSGVMHALPVGKESVQIFFTAPTGQTGPFLIDCLANGTSIGSIYLDLNNLGPNIVQDNQGRLSTMISNPSILQPGQQYVLSATASLASSPLLKDSNTASVVVQMPMGNIPEFAGLVELTQGQGMASFNTLNFNYVPGFVAYNTVINLSVSGYVLFVYNDLTQLTDDLLTTWDKPAAMFQLAANNSTNSSRRVMNFSYEMGGSGTVTGLNPGTTYYAVMRAYYSEVVGGNTVTKFENNMHIVNGSTAMSSSPMLASGVNFSVPTDRSGYTTIVMNASSFNNAAVIGLYYTNNQGDRPDLNPNLQVHCKTSQFPFNCVPSGLTQMQSYTVMAVLCRTSDCSCGGQQSCDSPIKFREIVGSYSLSMRPPVGNFTTAPTLALDASDVKTIKMTQNTQIGVGVATGFRVFNCLDDAGCMHPSTAQMDPCTTNSNTICVDGSPNNGLFPLNQAMPLKIKESVLNAQNCVGVQSVELRPDNTTIDNGQMLVSCITPQIALPTGFANFSCDTLNTTSNSIKVTWGAASPQGSTFNKLRVTYQQVGGGPEISPSSLSSLTANSVSATINGLTTATSYQINLYASYDTLEVPTPLSIQCQTSAPQILHQGVIAIKAWGPKVNGLERETVPSLLMDPQTYSSAITQCKNGQFNSACDGVDNEKEVIEECIFGATGRPSFYERYPVHAQGSTCFSSHQGATTSTNGIVYFSFRDMVIYGETITTNVGGTTVQRLKRVADDATGGYRIYKKSISDVINPATDLAYTSNGWTLTNPNDLVKADANGLVEYVDYNILPEDKGKIYFYKIEALTNGVARQYVPFRYSVNGGEQVVDINSKSGGHIVTVIIPGDNLALVHPWFRNQVACHAIGRGVSFNAQTGMPVINSQTSDPANNYSCISEGKDQAYDLEVVEDIGGTPTSKKYYDFMAYKHNQNYPSGFALFGRFEAGCNIGDDPYTRLRYPAGSASGIVGDAVNLPNISGSNGSVRYNSSYNGTTGYYVMPLAGQGGNTTEDSNGAYFYPGWVFLYPNQSYEQLIHYTLLSYFGSYFASYTLTPLDWNNAIANSSFSGQCMVKSGNSFINVSQYIRNMVSTNNVNGIKLTIPKMVSFNSNLPPVTADPYVNANSNTSGKSAADYICESFNVSVCNDYGCREDDLSSYQVIQMELPSRSEWYDAARDDLVSFYSNTLPSLSANGSDYLSSAASTLQAIQRGENYLPYYMGTSRMDGYKLSCNTGNSVWGYNPTGQTRYPDKVGYNRGFNEISVGGGFQQRNYRSIAGASSGDSKKLLGTMYPSYQATSALASSSQGLSGLFPTGSFVADADNGISTKACVSQFGIQDYTGNLDELTRDGLCSGTNCAIAGAQLNYKTLTYNKSLDSYTVANSSVVVPTTSNIQNQKWNSSPTNINSFSGLSTIASFEGNGAYSAESLKDFTVSTNPTYGAYDQVNKDMIDNNCFSPILGLPISKNGLNGCVPLNTIDDGINISLSQTYTYSGITATTPAHGYSKFFNGGNLFDGSRLFYTTPTSITDAYTNSNNAVNGVSNNRTNLTGPAFVKFGTLSRDGRNSFNSGRRPAGFRCMLYVPVPAGILK